MSEDRTEYGKMVIKFYFASEEQAKRVASVLGFENFQQWSHLEFECDNLLDKRIYTVLELAKTLNFAVTEIRVQHRFMSYSIWQDGSWQFDNIAKFISFLLQTNESLRREIDRERQYKEIALKDLAEEYEQKLQEKQQEIEQLKKQIEELNEKIAVRDKQITDLYNEIEQYRNHLHKIVDEIYNNFNIYAGDP